ncbi:hypothetical protein [Nitrosomonas mobilis]|nr:hypothetical protein [Nitrosomonas mobilis]
MFSPYSVRIKNLIEDLNKFYTLKMRPSGHDIDKGFAKGMTPEAMPLYDRIAAGESVSIEEYRQQTALAL